MIKTTDMRYRALKDVLSRVLGKGISFYKMNESIFDLAKEPLVFGINWCASGTRSVFETKEFVERLNNAAYIAETLNGFEILVDYNDEEPKIVDRDSYTAYCEALLMATKSHEWNYVRQLLEVKHE